MFDFAIPLQAPLGCRTNEQSFLRSKGVVDFHHGVIAGLTDTHMLFLEHALSVPHGLPDLPAGT
jgi:hypothetical protein